MILNGNQRGGGLKLAAHLLNDRENDHVEIHELRGFSADDLRGAFQEADAIAKGTRCTQFLFSLSLSPPETENVSIADFEAAIERIEERLGLQDQARAIVFHEKNGRRHAHAVWSRIDVIEMKAINLPYYHNRLKEVSKDLFLEHGWRLPEGLKDKHNRDPRNFTLTEWQQAKRLGKDARDIKRVFQEAWAVSDTKEAFANALEEKGYLLACGDRRGFVAVDVQGEVYAIPKMTGLKTKQVREKLGDPKQLRLVDEAIEQFAQRMQPALSSWQAEIEAQKTKREELHAKMRTELIKEQRNERHHLKTKLEERRMHEARERQSRFRLGLQGLWDKVRGAHRKISERNEQEAWQAHVRDQKIRDEMIVRHLDARRFQKRQHGVELKEIDMQQRDLVLDRERFAEREASRATKVRDENFPQR
ncbi:relaxase [uncultured Roseobacter sp.]|uniref:relaxase/mobilization nuclease domain-containing protein n=1 Tax=uncultured Roseobacter sp. TaxID=114847 RepID=UPI002628C157|nr:relaxase [uncultured Roseobacter sp.]